MQYISIQQERKPNKVEDGTEVMTEIPTKVCWHLQVIPHMKRLFMNPKEAKLMCWHAEDCKIDVMLRHHVDGAQWRNIVHRVS